MLFVKGSYNYDAFGSSRISLSAMAATRRNPVCNQFIRARLTTLIHQQKTDLVELLPFWV
jgi:hypothetical protein